MIFVMNSRRAVSRSRFFFGTFLWFVIIGSAMAVALWVILLPVLPTVAGILTIT